jgi:hypothetical protein
MADFIKLRLAAARVGVSMAFFALLAGLAEKARAVTPASSSVHANFLAQDAASNARGPTRLTLAKLDTALAKLEHKLSTSFETTHKLNRTFLKIKSANSTFLKIDDANTDFLKIDSANNEFLKIESANNEFLKIDSTASNSNKLDGLTAGQFVQGGGQVITGSVPAVQTNGALSPLLSLPGGIIVVSVQDISARGEVQVVIGNNSGSPLEAVDGNGVPHVLAEGNSVAVSLPVNPASQVHLQIFPSAASGAFPEVVTLIVSADNVGGTISVVGQAFTGGV